MRAPAPADQLRLLRLDDGAPSPREGPARLAPTQLAESSPEQLWTDLPLFRRALRAAHGEARRRETEERMMLVKWGQGPDAGLDELSDAVPTFRQEGGEFRGVPESAPGFLRFEAHYPDARKKAARMLSASAMGNQWLAKLRSCLTEVWRWHCRPVAEAAVPAVASHSADKPSAEDYLCWYGHGCMCITEEAPTRGPRQLVVDAALTRHLKSYFGTKKLREPLERLHVVACVAGGLWDVGEDPPEEEGAVTLHWWVVVPKDFRTYAMGFRLRCSVQFLRRGGVIFGEAPMI